MMHKFVVLALIPILASCNKFGGEKIYINSYSSYDEMILDDEKMAKNYKTQPKHFSFRFDSPEFNEEYYIGGICRCETWLFKREHANNNCYKLKNRELFVTYSVNNECYAILIYKDVPQEYCFSEKLEWIKNNGGNCYRYEPYKEAVSYILKDEYDNYLVGLKFVVEEDLIKNYFFEQVVNSFVNSFR